jgi:hypothetical protein
MKKISLRILTFILISAVIYFGIASVLIVIGKPGKFEQNEEGLAFNELFFDYPGLPVLKHQV